MVAKGWGVGVDLGLRLRRDTPHRSLRLFRFLKKYKKGVLRSNATKGKTAEGSVFSMKKRGKWGHYACAEQTGGARKLTRRTSRFLLPEMTNGKHSKPKNRGKN